MPLLGKNTFFSLLFSILFMFSLSGCSEVRLLSASFKSTESFISSETNSDVRYKGDNKEYANNVGAMMPMLVSRIQKDVGAEFLTLPKIYICDTWKCMEGYVGHSHQVRASANKKGIFLSPKLVGKIEATKYLLPHELTHALLADKAASFLDPIPPAWFDEGLATYLANGAGAEKCSREKAMKAIKDGKYFIPNVGGKLFSRMYGDQWGLKPHMFYRQSSIFVEQMKMVSPDGFRLLVSDVFNKNIKFSVLFLKYYGTTPSDLWSEYVEEIRETNSAG